MTIDPIKLAEILGQEYRPTDEQAKIVGAEPKANYLVVAGAGAGKTETMAARAVWLVANGHARPEEILGLTFTRKAAAELKHRIRERLQELKASEWFQTLPADDPRRETLNDIAPTTRTYDSHFGEIVREYGLLLPMETSFGLLTEPQRIIAIRQVIMDMSGEVKHEKSLADVVKAVSQLDNEITSHLAEDTEIVLASRNVIREMGDIQAGPRGWSTTALKIKDAVIAAQEERITYLKYLKEFRDRCRKLRKFTYGQLAAAAARIIREHPGVAVAQRGRFRYIMLDEYQDTSAAQHETLARLFGRGQSQDNFVMAVGDPMQSIYMFRGGAAPNLLKIIDDFPTFDAGTDEWKPSQKLELTTSWRNPSMVLELANEVADRALGITTGGPGAQRPSAESDAGAGRRRLVSRLTARPGAGEGDVSIGFFDRDTEELDWIAQEATRLWDEYVHDRDQARAAGEPEPEFSVAVLARKHKHLRAVRAALDAANIPTFLGAGDSLLNVPEVIDALAMLRLLANPADDIAFLRLVTGRRWNLGAADIVALSRVARSVARKSNADDQAAESEASAGTAAAQVSDMLAEADEDSSAAWEELAGENLAEQIHKIIASLSDVQVGLFEVLARSNQLHHHGMSEAGISRMADFLREYDHLSSRSMGKPLAELIADIDAVMLLRSEVITRSHAHPERSLGASNLDALIDYANDFTQSESGGIVEFVDFISEMVSSELDHPEEGARQTDGEGVTLMTIHAAKGLEWDVVFVPFANRTQFRDNDNASGDDGSVGQYLDSASALPVELRGDSGHFSFDGFSMDGLPMPDFSSIPNSSKLQSGIRDYKTELKRYAAVEGQRLFYVAVTRARQSLYLSASAYSKGKKPMDPAVILIQLKALLESCGKEEAIVRWSRLGPVALSGSDKTALKKDPNTDAAWVQIPAALEDERRKAQDHHLQALRDALQTAVISGVYNPLESPSTMWPRPRDKYNDRVEQAAAAVDQWRGKPLSAPSSDDSTLAAARRQTWLRETALLLEEHKAAESSTLVIDIPQRLTATEIVSLRKDAEQFARMKRRPLPMEPKPFAKRGTAFHNWVEEHYAQHGLFDTDQLPGAADAVLQDPHLEELKEAFRGSEWWDRTPAEVESEYSVVLAGKLIEGKIDAVFHDGDDPATGWTIVDWKTTGRIPTGAGADTLALQLAIYRLAWAKVLKQRHGVDVDPASIAAKFHYVAQNQTVEPQVLPTEAELADMLTGAHTRQ